MQDDLPMPASGESAGPLPMPHAERAPGFSSVIVTGCRRPQLTAGRAVLVVGLYLGAQIAVGILVGLAAMVLLMITGLEPQDPEMVAAVTQAATAPAAGLGLTGAGLLMLLVCRSWFREQLVDRSPCGAAWRLGSGHQLGRWLIAGGLLGLSYLGGVTLLVGDQEVRSMGPVTRMAMTPGGQQVIWVVMAIALAPLIEELLFRGALYGGMRRSWGPFWAALLSTTVFVVLHLGEIVHFLPAALALAAMAVTALVARLRTAAVGPAVAVHLGYNAVLAAVAVLSSFAAS